MTASPADDSMPRKMLSERKILDLIPVARSTLQQWEKDGLFPKSLAIGPNRKAWFESDVKAWVEAREKEQAEPTNLYRHFAGDGRLLYVGISLNAIIRLAAHRTRSSWFDEIVRVEVERHPTRQAALAAELAAIRNEKPLHNILGRAAA